MRIRFAIVLIGTLWFPPPLWAPVETPIPRGAIQVKPPRPNPFRGSTGIEIRWDATSVRDKRLALAVVNVAGRPIRSLPSITSNCPGVCAGVWPWDGHDDAGEPMPSGVYFFCLSARSAVYPNQEPQPIGSWKVVLLH